MKTMSINSASKKLESLTKRSETNIYPLAKNSFVYKEVLSVIKEGKKELRPVFSQGSSWSNSSLQDHSVKLTFVLNLIGIEFTTTNDAPRGGKTGFLINITTKFRK